MLGRHRLTTLPQRRAASRSKREKEVYSDREESNIQTLGLPLCDDTTLYIREDHHGRPYVAPLPERSERRQRRYSVSGEEMRRGTEDQVYNPWGRGVQLLGTGGAWRNERERLAVYACDEGPPPPDTAEESPDAMRAFFLGLDGWFEDDEDDATGDSVTGVQ